LQIVVMSFVGIGDHSGSLVENKEGCPLYQDYESLQGRIQEAIDRKEQVLWIVSKGI